MIKKAVVVGGSGFSGSHLVDHLVHVDLEQGLLQLINELSEINSSND